MAEFVEQDPKVADAALAFEEDEIERLLLELERLAARVERRAAKAAREAAEQGREIDRLLASLRADLAKHDPWFHVSSAT